MLMRVLTIIGTAMIAITGNMMVASPASAAYGCTGNLVGSWAVPLKDMLDGSTYYRSDVKLYYDASTGWNCAALVKRPGHARYGDKTPLFIEMYNERWAEDNYRNNYDQDQGAFKYYAGPVKVYGRNMCVSFNASHGDHEAHPGQPYSYNGRLLKTGVACG